MGLCHLAVAVAIAAAVVVAVRMFAVAAVVVSVVADVAVVIVVVVAVATVVDAAGVSRMPGSKGANTHIKALSRILLSSRRFILCWNRAPHITAMPFDCKDESIARLMQAAGRNNGRCYSYYSSFNSWKSCKTQVPGL